MLKGLVKSASIVSIFCILFFAGGCGAVAHDLVVNSVPTLNEVLEKSPPLQDGHARIVCYYPRVALAGFSLAGMGGWATIGIAIDGEKGSFTISMIDQSGFCIDVPAGQYAIAVAPGGGIEAEFLQSKSYFVKFTSNPNMLSTKLPVLVEPEEAIKELKEKNIRSDRFNFKDAFVNRYALMPKPEIQWESVSSELVSSAQKTDMSYLYVFNTKSPIVGPAVKIKTGVGCEPRYVIDCKKYACFEVSPGPHLLSCLITNFGAAYAPVCRTGCSAEAGKNTYCALSLEGLKLISEKEGLKLLKKYKAMKEGYYRIGKQ